MAHVDVQIFLLVILLCLFEPVSFISVGTTSCMFLDYLYWQNKLKHDILSLKNIRIIKYIIMILKFSRKTVKNLYFFLNYKSFII